MLVCKSDEFLDMQASRAKTESIHRCKRFMYTAMPQNPRWECGMCHVRTARLCGSNWLCGFRQELVSLCSSYLTICLTDGDDYWAEKSLNISVSVLLPVFYWLGIVVNRPTTTDVLFCVYYLAKCSSIRHHFSTMLWRYRWVSLPRFFF